MRKFKLGDTVIRRQPLDVAALFRGELQPSTEEFFTLATQEEVDKANEEEDHRRTATAD